MSHFLYLYNTILITAKKAVCHVILAVSIGAVRCFFAISHATTRWFAFQGEVSSHGGTGEEKNGKR
jgi:hypothetical protein